MGTLARPGAQSALQFRGPPVSSTDMIPARRLIERLREQESLAQLPRGTGAVPALSLLMTRTGSSLSMSSGSRGAAPTQAATARQAVGGVGAGTGSASLGTAGSSQRPATAPTPQAGTSKRGRTVGPAEPVTSARTLAPGTSSAAPSPLPEASSSAMAMSMRRSERGAVGGATRGFGAVSTNAVTMQPPWQISSPPSPSPFQDGVGSPSPSPSARPGPAPRSPQRSPSPSRTQQQPPAPPPPPLESMTPRSVYQQQHAALRADPPIRVPSPAFLQSPRRTARSLDAASGAGAGAAAPRSPSPSRGAGAVEAVSTNPIRLLAQRQAEALASRTTLRDCQMLAEASRRAGRTRLEGQCYFRMGVLHDAAGQLSQAASCYKKYLLACRRTGDQEGEALALNHLGVVFQMMGPEHMHRAMACHARHRDIADPRGRYTAHCNLGLLFMQAGQYDRAAANFRHALRYAIHLSNLKDERFAYEHLSAAGTLQGDLRFARSCMERCLALATTINDHQGRQAAFTQLGRLATARGDYDEASRCFSASLEVQHTARQLASRGSLGGGDGLGDEEAGAGGVADRAAVMADGPAAQQVRCELGVALGNAAFDKFMAKISESVTL